MDLREPFLFRFKQPCLSPNRASLGEGFQYDSVMDQVVAILDGQPVPAIDANLAKGPETKKGDIEKGDDRKDRWMWR